MLPQYVVYISIFTSIFAGYFYIRDTLNGKTTPNPVSWFIWFLAPFIAGLIQIQNGADLSAIPVLMPGVIPLVVSVLSLRNKDVFKKLSSLDYACLILSILALIAWLRLGEGVWATIFVILADGIAFIPTYVKSWKAPETETMIAYYSGFLNGFLSVATLRKIDFINAGFGVYIMFGCLVEVLIVFYRRKFLRKKGIL